MAHKDIELRRAMLLFEGAIGIALVDVGSGIALGTLGGSDDFDLTIAAAGNTDMVRAKERTMETLGLTDTIEDILVTTTDHYHLVRPLTARNGSRLFLYVALDRQRANLAMARHQLQMVETRLNA